MIGGSIKYKILVNKKPHTVYKTKNGKLFVKMKNENNEIIKKYLTPKQLGGFGTNVLENLRQDLKVFSFKKETKVHGVITDSVLSDKQKLDIHYLDFKDTDQIFKDVYQHVDKHKKIILAYRISFVNNIQVLEIEFTGKYEKFNVTLIK